MSGPDDTTLASMLSSGEYGPPAPLSSSASTPPPGRPPPTREELAEMFRAIQARALLANAPPAPGSPRPGEAGFASSVLAPPPVRAPNYVAAPSSVPAGPAPGEPGFDLSQVRDLPAVAPARPQVKLPPAAPAGAGQIDTSAVTPKGFSSGAVSIPNLPKGAGQVDTSETVKLGNKYAGGGGAGSASGPPSDINWAGAGGTVTIPAHEVPAVAAPRQTKLTDAIKAEGKAIENQEEAATGSALAAGEVEHQRGIGAQAVAKAYKDAGANSKLRQQEAADALKVYRKNIDDFSEAVAKERIRPNRMFEDASVPAKIGWILAEGIGGAVQAYNHTSTNQVADKIQNMVAADVAAQRANHEINRERVADMNTMYGLAMRDAATTEDAERLATGYALKAAENDAQALVHNSTSEVQKARGRELVAALQERQAQIGQKEAQTEIQMNPLVQARTVSAGPDMKEVYKTARGYIDDQAKLGNVVKPDEAIRYAYKMHTGRDPLTGAGTFNQGAKLEGGNKELKETQTAADEFNKQMDNLQNHPIITGTGLSEAALSHLPQRIAPQSNDAQQQLNAINTRNLQAIGKVAKDADGKPNKEMIQKIEHDYKLTLDDRPEMKQQKLNSVRDIYNALARQQGAKTPELGGSGTPPGFKP